MKTNLLKNICAAMLLMMTCSAFAQNKNGGGEIGSADHSKLELRTSKAFLAVCPEKYLTYYDKNEGGPGAYCNCPDENITYIDKAEGGPGYVCLENSGGK